MDLTTISLTLRRDVLNFYHSSDFLFLKILIGIYVLVVLYDIVLLVIQRGVGANWRQMKYGIDMPKELMTKNRKMKLRWEKIRKRLEGEDATEYKVAIIEADALIDDLITRMGYGGDNMAERIANIPEGSFEGLNDIKEAHEIRNRIIHEDNFLVDRDFAHDVLHKFEHLLRHFQVLD